MMKTHKIAMFSLLISGAGLIESCKQREEKHLKNDPPTVSVALVNSQDTVQAMSYSGSISPENTTEVAFAVAGIVNKVAVEEGQAVTKGQFLASIDATEYEAALQIASVTLNQVEDAFDRFDALYKKGSFPEKDYIEIKSKVVQAQAAKAISKKRIDDSRLLAPSNGIITSKKVEAGASAAPGLPAFTIVKTDMVYAQFTVPESEIGKFARGMLVKVNVPTLGQIFNGKISIINPMADQVSKTFTLKVKLDNSSGRLLPGMIVETTTAVATSHRQLSVPLTSITNDFDGISHVFIVDSSGIVKSHRVTVGKVLGSQVIITDGVQPGQMVVTAGQTNIRDGQKVNTGQATKPAAVQKAAGI